MADATFRIPHTPTPTMLTDRRHEYKKPEGADKPLCRMG
jgi:hypothetical protein